MSDYDHQKHLDKSRTDVRRKKSEMKDESQIKSLLHSAPFGHMASVHGSQPFLIPLIYVYVEEDHAVYFHGAPVGRTRANIELNPNVCFNVTRFGRVLLADTISKFNIEYNSATIFGKASRIDEHKEKEQILILLAEKFSPHFSYGEDYPKLSDDDIKTTAIFKIKIEEWSGKQNEEASDFKNAYTYPNFPKRESNK